MICAGLVLIATGGSLGSYTRSYCASVRLEWHPGDRITALISLVSKTLDYLSPANRARITHKEMAGPKERMEACNPFRLHF